MGLLGNLLSSSVDGVVIELDKEKTPYLIGEKVTGAIHISTQKDDVKIAKITLDVTGEQKISVQYRKTKRSKKGKVSSSKHTAYNNVTFFTENLIIDGKEQILPLGTKKYKFEFDLPKEAHNSLDAPGASVSYMLKCTVDIPWGIDAEGSLEMFVNEIKDLNESIETLETVDSQEETNVGCGCFAQGPISLNVNMEKTGFVCGEKAAINIKVLNNTNKVIKNTWLDLENTVWKKADGQTENVRNDIFEAVDVGAVEPNGEKTFNYLLIIPQVPISSNNDEKDSIKNSYKINVKVVADVTFGGEVDVTIPVTIGNIPHKKSFPSFQKQDGELHQISLSDWKDKYPALPGYTGEKYISYKPV